jgi:uncharacterized protein DUF3179
MSRQFLAVAMVGGALIAHAAPTAQTPAKPSLGYTAVHDPQFTSAAEATFLNDEDRVIGVMTGATAKAFPAGILSQHGLVEDQSPKGPIAITW